MSYSLASFGQSMKDSGRQGLRDAAQREEQREIANDQLKSAKKQQQMSSTAAGAMVGTYVMPGIGTAVGAVVGYAFGSL